MGLVGFGGRPAALHEERLPPNQGNENAVAQEMPGGSRLELQVATLQPLARETSLLTTPTTMTLSGGLPMFTVT